MLLTSCANPPVEAERHFKSAEMFNQVTRNSKEVLVTLSAITHSTKVMAETMFLAFLLHLIPLFHPLLQYKHYETHPASHQGLECSPMRTKQMGKADLHQMVVTVAFLATPARNRLAGSAITVFSSNTFALALFHCIKVVSRELFLKGASQHSYQAVKTLPFPMAVCKCSPSGMHGSNNAKIRSFLSSTCQKA